MKRVKEDKINRRRCEYLYDAQWRRILTTDLSNWSDLSGSYTTTNTTRFVWDGWNLFAEIIQNQQSTITNYYIWGLDLSQSLQGAGGIGGLLAISKGGVGVPPAIYFPVCDGNGNITDYLNNDGTTVAHREYDPFGRTVAATSITRRNWGDGFLGIQFGKDVQAVFIFR